MASVANQLNHSVYGGRKNRDACETAASLEAS